MKSGETMQAHRTGVAMGMLRAASISPELRVADVDFNVAEITAAMAQAAAQGVQLALFPELCITAYSCGDLFFQTQLHEAAAAGLQRIAEATATHEIAVVVGLPVPVDGRLYNCAALLAQGQIIGVVPKIFLPNYNEFYEARWFRSGEAIRDDTLRLAGEDAVPFGVDLLFRATNHAGLRHWH